MKTKIKMNEKIEWNALSEVQVFQLLLLGLVWGGLELLLTPVFKTAFPQFSGIIIALIVVFYVLTVRSYFPISGAVMAMAIIAATMKFLIAESVLTNVFMAILIQAAIIELFFFLFKSRRSGFLLTGLFVELYNLLHPVLSKGSFLNCRSFILFRRWLADIMDYQNVSQLSQTVTVVVLALMHIAAGVLAGWLAWKTANYLASREKSGKSVAETTALDKV